MKNIISLIFRPFTIWRDYRKAVSDIAVLNARLTAQHRDFMASQTRLTTALRPFAMFGRYFVIRDDIMTPVLKAGHSALIVGAFQAAHDALPFAMPDDWRERIIKDQGLTNNGVSRALLISSMNQLVEAVKVEFGELLAEIEGAQFSPSAASSSGGEASTPKEDKTA